MAALTQSSKAGPNWKTPTINTLSASDTLTYQPGAGQELYLINTTAGALTVTVTGSAGAANTPVIGGGIANYSTGSTLGGAIAAGAGRFVRLDDIPNLLQGNVTLTGASGLSAILMGP